VRLLLLCSLVLNLISCISSRVERKETIYEDDDFMVQFVVIDKGIASESLYLFYDKKRKIKKQVNKTDKNYKFNEGYLYITSFQSGKLEPDGMWVNIHRKVREDNKLEISFEYDSIPKSIHGSGYLDTLQTECIYKLTKGNSFSYIGSLREYDSFHDLEDGVFYLAKPGFFYYQKVSIKEFMESSVRPY